ncbi:MAG TPA: VOC family protein [Streptosporangiaceae bacterium]|nr:VOC family protein [Streptosporangiaceae bacterium]
MAYEFQVVIDSERPHELAAWWAQTLGWEVEPQDEAFIKKMIAEGHASDADTITFNGALVWRDGGAIRYPGEVGSALHGPHPRVLFQLVPEGKTVKNRLHLDVRIGSDNSEDVVAKLTERGATFLHTGSQGPHTWVTMADPEGNEFCVS